MVRSSPVPWFVFVNKYPANVEKNLKKNLKDASFFTPKKPLKHQNNLWNSKYIIYRYRFTDLCRENCSIMGEYESFSRLSLLISGLGKMAVDLDSIKSAISEIDGRLEENSARWVQYITIFRFYYIDNTTSWIIFTKQDSKLFSIFQTWLLQVSFLSLCLSFFSWEIYLHLA